MPPTSHDSSTAVTLPPWREEEIRLVERGALLVAFSAGLLVATRKGNAIPFMLGWGASVAFALWASKS